MDATILKALLNSCEDVAKNIQDFEDYKELNDDEFYLPSDVLITALCTSLTNLLSYNVSKEAYQRYSVRLHIIELLRDWCRIRSPFSSLTAFTRQENTWTFVENLISKYLTNEILEQCNCPDTLVPLVGAITFLGKKKQDFMKKAEEVIVKICQLESTNKSQKLLWNIARNHANSCYEQSVLELIFATQKYKLIEEPLLNSFVSTCSKLSDFNKESNDDDQAKISAEQLFEFVVKSPTTFKLISGCMKEMMVHLNYAPTFTEFIRDSLNKISDLCKSRGKDILDLYPQNAQSIVILLGISPSSHTTSSEQYTLESLKEIYLNNKEDALVLLSQFPDWLDAFTTLLKNETD